MAPRLVPEHPKFETATEREVWEVLRTTLAPDDVLMANLRLSDEVKDHEADIVAIIGGAGVVVIEVKGGSVGVVDGRWRQSGNDTRTFDPVDQARTTKYAIRKYVEADPRWRNSSRRRIRWAHSVALPNTDLHDDFSMPDCPRWAVHGLGDIANLASRLHDVVVMQETRNVPPTPDDVDLIVEILNGRHLPALDISAEARARAAEVDRLTQEQATLLRVTRLLNRVEVRGGAGSGKTVLALTQARQLSRGHGGHKPQRVAVICYSLGLAAYFNRVVESWGRKHRPAFVGTFHALGRSWGAPDGSRDNSDFWELELPAIMKELAAGLADGQKFDSIIVDEAQDFADSWWAPIMGALKDQETGGLFAYSDENQRIFQRFGGPPVPMVPLVLDHNLRNTKQIGDAFNPLAPMRMQLRGGNGPEVEFARSSAADALDTADEQVDRLLALGWKSDEVMLLTTGKRHPVQIERGSESDPAGYWRSFWDDGDVFYGHVLGCKGLERRAVVLCVNEDKAVDRSRERLYVGLSRATDQLVVVGDPDVVAQMGGAEVARRLGIS
ncbi:MAG TPA: NERD domain-containing protein [Dermatophilaceae bacterium]|nr:NERD domain-containing protein [Dermatophilaceae bacterium]